MPPRRRPSSAQPTSLSDLLKATPVGKAAASVLISRTLWEEVAGVAFARRTKPDRLERGTLYVWCGSSGWAQELAMHSAVLVERMRARGIEVERIRFRVAEVEPPERGGVAAPSSEELARARRAEPGEVELDALGKVASPTLRETLARTARAVARRAAEVDAHDRAARDRKPRIPGKRAR